MQYFKNKKLLIIGLILTFVLTLSITYAKTVGNDIKNSVLRLHIVANSNSEEDQRLKLSVRDRIIEETSALFRNATSPQDAEETAKANLDKICRLAENEIKSQGFDYSVKAKIGEFPFPTKTYSDITLPSGKYNALRIEIGNASGENWWCVMYPPLCFTDGIISAGSDTKLKLKNTLTDEEYALITKTDNGRIPVEIRFKIVEIFRNLF